jgi:hypothetical protein
MPRILTPTAAQAILARETAEVFLVCLTISGPGLDTLRAVNNTQPIVRSMGTFHPYPFEAVLPEDTDSASPQVQLRVDNVDLQVTRALREYQGVPQCTLEVVLASNPDVVEVGPFEFSILAAEYDALVITATLGYEEDFLNQAVPAQTYTPSNSPGMFV